jgi:hypothetical protein
MDKIIFSPKDPLLAFIDKGEQSNYISFRRKERPFLHKIISVLVRPKHLGIYLGAPFFA